MKKEKEKKITTKKLHQLLQEIAANELSRLPEFLEQLPPVERVQIVLKLLPYAAPKVENVTASFNSGMDFGWDD